MNLVVSGIGAAIAGVGEIRAAQLGFVRERKLEEDDGVRERGGL